jgi:hypothetical protein
MSYIIASTAAYAKIASTAAIYACFFPCLLLAADELSPEIGRPSVGVRVEYMPLRLFNTSTSYASTTSPIADYTYTGGSTTPRLGGAGTIEYRWTRHVSLGVEVHFHHAQFQQTTQMKSGKPDPNTSADDRKVSTISDTTKANYWEIPLLVHYYSFPRLHPTGLLSRTYVYKLLPRTYVTGGLDVRHVGRIRTGNEFSYADGETDYNENPTLAHRVNNLGCVVGVGLRFIDDFRIKVSPEVRYVRWLGTTYEGPNYSSARGQLEVGIGLSF